MTNFSNISESPVQFTRRNLFKSAAAGAATMATAGLSVAQAAPKKEGTYANNGAPEALRIRNDRISDENKKTLMALPCKYVPVAVKFYAVKPENFGLKYKHTDKRMSLCQFVSYAQKTHSSFYIDKTNEDCMGRTVLGMVQEPPLGASGQAGFDFGVFRNQDANSRLYYNIPIAIRDTINYVIFSPIDQCEFNPDVVVFVGDSDMADIVMRATSYISGDLWESKSSSVLSCAWTYMYTWLSGKVNHCQTGMHHGMGRRKVYPKGLHIVSVPYQKLDEVCLALRQMDWQLISFRPNDKDQDELRRRMRNWNALSKQINESYSFALPENKVQK
ncbi:MAG TPA: DUF169 domain-containing protein [Candidatus Duodenibacillus intestinigallinarum]|jgi:uncharacterized protein (DUF169 family)|nr:DUF169 domain-containing protein [Candidatus Duodenibacillus intestinigallinarum]